MRRLTATVLASMALLACMTGEAGSEAGANSAAKIVFAGRCAAGQGIYTVDPDGTGLRRLTRGDDEGPVWSPDRRWIAFTRGRVIGEDFRGDDIRTLDLYVMRVDGSGQRRVAKIAHDPDWSPDGRRLTLVHKFGGGQVSTIRTDGSDFRRFGRGERPGWSPDGSRIAFPRWTGGFYETFVMRANGSGEHRLLRRRTESDAPSWSPNARSISFIGRNSLFVVATDGQAPRLLARLVAETENPPPWSPDGRSIAFTRYPNSRSALDYANNHSIYSIEPSSRDSLRKLAGPGTSNPRWSPDGGRIAFQREHANGDTVHVMNADGTNVHRIASCGGYLDGMDW